MTDAKKTARPNDEIVAHNIKARRLKAGLSQEQVADALGLTFQQVQKYENAKNRISAGKLPILAKAFGCNVMDFFQGVDGISDLPPAPILPRSANDPASLIEQIPDEASRRHVLGIIKAMIPSQAA